ncbi:MAG TPA: 30S ribosomal protein S20 [Patescibacteria group bacterium]|nr:30S ribosomal protein S20 [Patescibacteria group bacterium]
MPVTKTAKRALRSSKEKESINKIIVSNLEFAVRQAKKLKTRDLVTKAISLTDRAAKKGVMHKNKAARIKSQLAKLMPKSTPKAKKTVKKVAKKK